MLFQLLHLFTVVDSHLQLSLRTVYGFQSFRSQAGKAEQNTSKENRCFFFNISDLAYVFIYYLL